VTVGASVSHSERRVRLRPRRLGGLTVSPLFETDGTKAASTAKITYIWLW